MPDQLSAAIAATLQEARRARGLSGGDLAELSGVSRAMISKIERGEAQPSAVLLGRLSGALGMSLSELVAHAERADHRIARAAEQPRWTDPATGYVRRAVSPGAGGPLELVEVALPAATRVGFPAATYTHRQQQIWVLAGRLLFHEGPLVHDLAVGDCLQLGPPADCVFENPGPQPCRYLVALARRAS